jgi:hypothetical protein
MKQILLRTLLTGMALAVFPLYGQQPSVKRHQGEHLHYKVTFQDGDIGKIVAVNVSLRSSTAAPPTQPNAQTQFGAQCQKSTDPKVWDCDVQIPQGIADGDYQLFTVGVGTSEFGKNYSEDFHVPIVPIQNSNTFTPPSKVTVTPQP